LKKNKILINRFYQTIIKLKTKWNLKIALLYKLITHKILKAESNKSKALNYIKKVNIKTDKKKSVNLSTKDLIICKEKSKCYKVKKTLTNQSTI